MKKRNLVGHATTPDGQTISLIEQDGTYSIRINSAELMSTRTHASEEKLAELACAHAGARSGARVLVGGLGMGFTLKAALAALPPDATVLTAEILPAVIAWNRNPAFPLAGTAMTDPRVTILEQDVMEVIRAAAPETFDSIILDVDNGPAALTTSGNARLYASGGLRLMFDALRSEGCAAFWSAAPDPPFEKLLAAAGFKVEVHRCRANLSSGRWHTLFVGRRVDVSQRTDHPR